MRCLLIWQKRKWLTQKRGKFMDTVINRLCKSASPLAENDFTGNRRFSCRASQLDSGKDKLLDTVCFTGWLLTKPVP